ncbi:Versiconal hemiacetal acetate reductase [Candida viswanathii]|jgi:aryl-alcohol dehydrogenase-like predicted oxidoreductase|uniref:Versiconal hemiacetal acetate reductase n=1 Tax=Candida viswanathii TaxID=5486 RepID=A0A367Y4N5_9ASCO|nr:Versiconal hemiacetal acetate reductase [Candida viswanathii]
MSTIDKSKFVTRLGSSGLKVNTVAIGTMRLGSNWLGFNGDIEECLQILKFCYDNNFRTFDTADAYSNGKSEELLGMFIKKYNIPRERIVILTKCYFPVKEGEEGMGDTDPVDFMNDKGLSRKHILAAAQNSVKRLGTYIDVLQIHRLDHEVPKEEIMRALNDVVEQGLTRYIGASSMKAWEFVELQNIAKQNGWHKFISMQSHYSLLYREDDRELNDYCKNNGIGLIPWSPNAGGALCRPFDSDKNKQFFANKEWCCIFGLGNVSEIDKTIIDRVEELSIKYNASMMQVSLAWCVAKGFVPIAGVSKLAHAEELIGIYKVNLSEEDIKYLDEPYHSKDIAPRID